MDNISAKFGEFGAVCTQAFSAKSDKLVILFAHMRQLCQRLNPNIRKCQLHISDSFGKLGTQTLGGSVIGNFSVQLIFSKWCPFFHFFIMANADIPFPMTLRNQRCKFSVDIVFRIFRWFSFPHHSC